MGPENGDHHEACTRGSARVLWALLALTAMVVVAARVAGPSDLVEKTQWKTIGYTADMVLNGRWLLPRDSSGQPATKPPLYNWIDAAVIGASGVWAEWTFKLPSIVSGLALTLLCISMTRWMSRQGRPAGSAATVTAEPAALGIVSGGLLLAGYAVFRQIYIARVDMLLAVFVCGAWALGTVALARASRGGERRGTALPALGMWVCIGAAGLTKGPVALLPVLYLPLAARLIHGRWGLLKATHFWWGLPLAGGIVAAWAVPAARMDPEHFWAVIVRGEVVERVSEGGPGRILTDVWKMPVYFLFDYMPSALFTVAALIWIRPRAWMRHPLAPAVLWLLLNLVVFSCSGGKASRYLLPLYPAAAALAAHWLLTVGARLWLTPTRIALAALLVAVGLGVYQWTLSRAAETRFGDNTKAFAAEVRSIIGDDPIVFLTIRSKILPTLLGRHAPGPPTPAELARARWAVQDYPQKAKPAAVSGAVWKWFPGTRDRIALYRLPARQQ